MLTVTFTNKPLDYKCMNLFNIITTLRVYKNLNVFVMKNKICYLFQGCPVNQNQFFKIYYLLTSPISIALEICLIGEIT